MTEQNKEKKEFKVEFSGLLSPIVYGLAFLLNKKEGKDMKHIH